MVDFDKQRAMAKNRVRRRGIYILPNLFTTAALFAGFYAIVQAMNQRFDMAAIAIFIARSSTASTAASRGSTRTQSAFGAEFDSLADMVSFGAAPALVIYEWSLKGLGKLGWIAAFVYVAGAALRLARFNTQLEVADKRWFQGLPSPSAGALVAGFVFIVDDYGVVAGGRAVVGVGDHAVRRARDGVEPQVLQLQGDQPEEERAVRRGVPVRRRDRAAVLPARARAVRRLRRVLPLRLRGVGVVAVAPAPHPAGVRR